MIDILNKMRDDLEAAIPQREVEYYIIGLPWEAPAQAISKGLICIEGVSISSSSATTGTQDLDDLLVNIHLLKQLKTEFNRDAQTTAMAEYMYGLMSMYNKDGTTNTASIPYVLRQNIRTYGDRYLAMDIQFNSGVIGNVNTSGAVSNKGAASATLSLTVQKLRSQPIN